MSGVRISDGSSYKKHATACFLYDEPSNRMRPLAERVVPGGSQDAKQIGLPYREHMQFFKYHQVPVEKNGSIVSPNYSTLKLCSACPKVGLTCFSRLCRCFFKFVQTMATRFPSCSIHLTDFIKLILSTAFTPVIFKLQEPSRFFAMPL